MRYLAPILAIVIGFAFLGPIGAVLALLVWWMVKQSK